MSENQSQPSQAADVIVVGAGPGGSTTAAYLAAAGLDVLLLEKSAFPREKVCGDGLTPRAVKELVALGIPTRAEDGWIRNQGLRVIGGGVRMQIPWPELSSFPDYGLVRPRKDFDETLARHAEKAGARLLERTSVTGPGSPTRSPGRFFPARDERVEVVSARRRGRLPGPRRC